MKHKIKIIKEETDFIKCNRKNNLNTIYGHKAKIPFNQTTFSSEDFIKYCRRLVNLRKSIFKYEDTETISEYLGENTKGKFGQKNLKGYMNPKTLKERTKEVFYNTFELTEGDNQTSLNDALNFLFDELNKGVDKILKKK